MVKRGRVQYWKWHLPRTQPFGILHPGHGGLQVRNGEPLHIDWIPKGKGDISGQPRTELPNRMFYRDFVKDYISSFR